MLGERLSDATILCGRRSTDSEAAQLGLQIAEMVCCPINAIMLEHRAVQMLAGQLSSAIYHLPLPGDLKKGGINIPGPHKRCSG